MNITEELAQELNIKEVQVEKTINLIDEGNTIPLGVFDNEEEAKKEFIKHKESAIVSMADRYKNKIPNKLYKAMIDFKIELSDWK